MQPRAHHIALSLRRNRTRPRRSKAAVPPLLASYIFWSGTLRQQAARCQARGSWSNQAPPKPSVHHRPSQHTKSRVNNLSFLPLAHPTTTAPRNLPALLQIHAPAVVYFDTSRRRIQRVHPLIRLDTTQRTSRRKTRWISRTACMSPSPPAPQSRVDGC